MSSRAPGARVPRSTADQPPPPTDASGERNAVTLGPRDRLIGTLHIEGDLRLGGIVEGGVEATGDVEIDDEAKVNASVAGRDVSIRGHVNGHVTARKRLMVAKTGSLTGDVHVARLVIQDGASFSGNVSMGPQGERAAKPPEPEPAPPSAQDSPSPSADGKAIKVAEPEPARAPKPPPGKGKPKR
ncbi:MAG TPA: polymer-forming cytoskeletal protein [Candidatus Dormibacteraeota bacterium]|nr:polymer-forming cytoskeletal protein [Candidatus Dormibacteraeota bacterium]